MRYRIVKKTFSSGLCEFYIQQRFLFFWFYVNEMISFGYEERKSFYRLKEAKEYIDHLEFKNKVIKTEILK